MTTLKKRKGKYLGKFFFDSLKKENFILLCYTTDMRLNTGFSIRKEMNRIQFGFKYLKRKPVLRFFDGMNGFRPIMHFLNGSLVLVFAKRIHQVDLKILELLQKNKTFSFLGFYWKRFYLSFDLIKITSGVQKLTFEKDLFQITKQYKYIGFSKVKNIVTKKMGHVGFASFFSVLTRLKILMI